jgi:hypothetical protein
LFFEAVAEAFQGDAEVIRRGCGGLAVDADQAVRLPYVHPRARQRQSCCEVGWWLPGRRFVDPEVFEVSAGVFVKRSQQCRGETEGDAREGGCFCVGLDLERCGCLPEVVAGDALVEVAANGSDARSGDV